MSSRHVERHRLRVLRSHAILDTPPEAPFERITKLAAAVLGVPMAAVTLVDEDRQWFKSEIGLGVCETPRDQSFCAHTMYEPEAMVVRDATLDPRFAGNPLVTGGPSVRFYAGVPLVTRSGIPLGALCAIDSAPRDVTARELDLLTDLAKIACEQLELRYLASLDDLTGAMRRTSFLSHLEHDLQAPSVHGTSVLMIDVDHFKTLNDRFGHAAGDHALVEMVGVFRANLREDDYIGRLGGEEFCVAVPDAGQAAAYRIAERLRQSLEDARICFEGQVLPVTISVGVAAALVGDGDAPALLQRADTALYEAKEAGRNRVFPVVLPKSRPRLAS
jgi:diguanylate cyclase (GGDEF)-like protein